MPQINRAVALCFKELQGKPGITRLLGIIDAEEVKVTYGEVL